MIFPPTPASAPRPRTARCPARCSTSSPTTSKLCIRDSYQPGKFRDEDDDYYGYDAGGESDFAAAGYTLKEGSDDDDLAAADAEELDDSDDFSDDYSDEDMD